MGHPGFIGGQKNVSRAVVDLRYAKLPRVVRDFLAHDRRGVHHVEFFEQELEALLELLSDLFAKRFRQRPEALFQRAEAFFACFINEVLGGLPVDLLGGAFLAQIIVDFFFHRRGESRIVVEHVLKTRRQVDLRAAALREMVEGLLRQRRCAVLHRAGEAVFLPRDLGELLQRVEVELHARDRSVGQRDAAVRRAGLNADLADAFEALGAFVEFFAVAIHVGLELLDGAVFLAHLADLAAYRYRDALGLQAAHMRGQLGRDPAVVLLLRANRGAAQIDERRAVDVDVVEFRFDRFFDEIFESLDFRLRVLREILRARLKVIALNEERACKAFLDRGRRHDMGILRGALEYVADLRARDLEDHRADAVFEGGAKDRPRRIERHAADIDRRHGEAADFPAADRVIQVLNGCGVDAKSSGGPAHGVPRGGLDCGIFAENAVENETVDNTVAELLRIDDTRFPVAVHDALKAFFELFLTLIPHIGLLRIAR